MQDRRAHLRKLMLVAASVGDASGTTWHPVLFLDISRIGITFASARIMESGAAHMVRFCFPGSARRHEVVVKILHSSNENVFTGYRVGARFIAVDAGTVGLIAEFVGAFVQT